MKGGRGLGGAGGREREREKAPVSLDTESPAAAVSESAGNWRQKLALSTSFPETAQGEAVTAPGSHRTGPNRSQRSCLLHPEPASCHLASPLPLRPTRDTSSCLEQQPPPPPSQVLPSGVSFPQWAGPLQKISGGLQAGRNEVTQGQVGAGGGALREGGWGRRLGSSLHVSQENKLLSQSHQESLGGSSSMQDASISFLEHGGPGPR